MSADLEDRTDFENANRGLITRLEPGMIKAADGRVVYDADVYTRTMAGGPRSSTARLRRRGSARPAWHQR